MIRLRHALQAMAIIGWFVWAGTSLSIGCAPNRLCPQGINDLIVDTRNQRCTTSCDCNNQAFTGVCIDGTCQSEQRQPCPTPGAWQACTPLGQQTCQGNQQCQSAVLFAQVWGDCLCRDEFPQTEPTSEPTPEQTNTEHSSEPKPEPTDTIDAGEPTTEPRTESHREPSPPDLPPTEQRPDVVCSVTEICEDGKDNNCNGLIDEGCAPCSPVTPFLQLTGHRTSVLPPHHNRAGQLTISLDTNGRILVRAASTGRLIRQIPTGQTPTRAVQHPTKPLLIVGDTTGTVRVWDVTTGQSQQPFGPASSQQPITALAISPNGAMIAWSHKGTNSAEVWQWSPAKQQGTLPTVNGHNGEINHLLFSPSGTQLASGGADRTIRLWSLPSLTWQRTLDADGNGPQRMAFSPNGNDLWALSLNNPAIIQNWDPQTGQQRTQSIVHTHAIHAFVLHTNGQTLATADQRQQLTLWSLPGRTSIRSWSVQSSPITGLRLTANQTYLISSHSLGDVHTWNTSNGQQQWHFREHQQEVTALKKHPTLPLLATGSKDSSIQLTSLATGSLQAQLTGHRATITSLAYTPSGRWLATSDSQGDVRFWDGETNQLYQTLSLYPTTSVSIRDMAFAPSERTLATVSDGTAGTVLWNTQGKQLAQLIQTQQTANKRLRVAFHPTGTSLFVLAEDNTLAGFVEQWDLRASPPTLKGRLTGLLAISSAFALHPTGSILATSNNTQTQLWDLRTQQVYQTIPGRSQALVWGPKGRLLAFAQGTHVGLWDLQRQQILQRRQAPWTVKTLAFSLDGGQLILQGNDANESIRVWSCACASGEKGICFGGLSAPPKAVPCQRGQWRCTTMGQRLPCVGFISPRPEQADGIDNDCDGLPDNGFVDLALTVLEVTPQTASSGDTLQVRVCVSNIGHLQSRSGAIQVRLLLSDNASIEPTDRPLTGQPGQAAHFSFGRLQGGQSEVCQRQSIALPLGLTPGNRFVIGQIHTQGDYQEAQTSNNQKAAAVVFQ